MITLRVCVLAVLASCVSGAAVAQGYPERPLRLIVPLVAGSGTDLMTRLLAQKLGERLGQQVIVDNRGGAGGMIGAELAARSQADGYTLFMGGSVTLTITPAVYSKIPYDPLRDFMPVASISRFYSVLVATPSINAKSMSELIAYSRSHPGELRLASAEPGTASHLAGQLLASMAKIDLLQVPYKGGTMRLNALATGESHASFLTVSAALQFVKQLRLPLLGVTSLKRLSPLPAVPAIAESVPGYEWSGWQILMVPARTQPAVIDRLRLAVTDIVASQEFKRYLSAEGSEGFDKTPDELRQYIRAEMTRNGALVKSSGARAD
ncbi:MAG: tripartite tricarboxylate transporter substrate binding protein [Burkholderiales bacterium]|nr:tripartite tricarboxylate transporter substrate binding protein [Burkholderiales bacterium]MCW5603008.1 tripartite tricarboxylate transporter substrate binding protein [Burkholderiales bacterium]